MTIRLSAPLLAGLLCFSLSACDSASTNIVEKDPIAKPDDDHDHGHSAEGGGRLLVISSASPLSEAQIYDLEDNNLIDTFSLTQTPSAVHSSAGYRYAALISRTSNYVGFLDGGVWREDHVDHLHDYEEAPVLMDYSLSGSQPTHVVKHEDQLAIFYDGLAATATSALAPASVQVLTDSDIGARRATLPSIAYTVNMHGAAEPRGEHVLATVRRADADTASGNPVLPDQVGVYHLHEGEYEQEEILGVNCPDLHGAAQNENYIAFGCSDGVLLVEDMDGLFVPSKIANPAELSTDLRVGSLFGHEHSEQLIGRASALEWVSIDPVEGEMQMIDWQPVADAQSVSYGFSFDGERFLILDNQGYLTILESHIHDGHMEWEYTPRIDITEENPADLPEGQRFTMTIAQNANLAYISDPMAQHIVIVDLEDGDVVGQIELDFAPAFITWLGIPEVHDH